MFSVSEDVLKLFLAVNWSVDLSICSNIGQTLGFTDADAEADADKTVAAVVAAVVCLFFQICNCDSCDIHHEKCTKSFEKHYQQKLSQW